MNCFCSAVMACGSGAGCAASGTAADLPRDSMNCCIMFCPACMNCVADPKNASLLFDPCAMGRLVSLLLSGVSVWILHTTPGAVNEFGGIMRPRSGPPLVHCCRQPGIRYKYAFPARIPRMSLVLIIVIGWLYVTLLVAANEPTVTSV